MIDCRSLPLYPPIEKGLKNLILVAMHHTFDKDHPLPERRYMENREIKLLVDCLYYENKGLFECPRNKEAMKKVRDEVIQNMLQ